MDVVSSVFECPAGWTQSAQHASGTTASAAHTSVGDRACWSRLPPKFNSTIAEIIGPPRCQGQGLQDTRNDRLRKAFGDLKSTEVLVRDLVSHTAFTPNPVPTLICGTLTWPSGLRSARD